VAGELIVVSGAEESVRNRIAASLHAEGYKVLNVVSEEAAVSSLGLMKLVVPDLVLTTIGTEAALPPLVEHLRASPVTQDIPVLLFASGTPEERRRALLLGISDLVQHPYDSEEVVLMVRLALDRVRERRRTGEVLQGTLSMLPLAELLQSLEAGRRSAVLEITSRGRSGTIWIRSGRVIDAETSHGRNGEEAFFSIFPWTEGTFTVAYGSVVMPERIAESTTGLLLEAARRADEAERDEEQPPFASIPDPQPGPPPELLAAHRALTLLNIASSYAAGLAQPPLLAAALEETRRAGDRLDVLDLFVVSSEGQIAMRDPHAAPPDIAALVTATGGWLQRFFLRMNRALPGRFEPRNLRSLTEAVRDDMESLGFYAALGLSSAVRRPAPEDQ